MWTNFGKSIFLIAILVLSGNGLFAQDIQYGLARAYNDAFDGDITAYGLVYNKNEFTAAHNLFPKGALLNVKRLDNNKTVQVRVIDKGPWIQGYVIDLSRAAANRLQIMGSTSAEVEVTLVRMPEEPKQRVASAPVKQKPEPAAPKTYETTPAPKPSVKVNLPQATEKGIPTNVSPSAKSKVQKPESQIGVFKVAQVPDDEIAFGVQIASLQNPEYLFEEVKRLQKEKIQDIYIVMDKNLLGDLTYKIVLGSFPDSEKAGAYKASLGKKFSRMKGSFVVTY